MYEVTLTLADLLMHLAVACGFMVLACLIAYWGNKRKP